MLFELIAVITAGFLSAGLVLIGRRAVRAVPRWLVPVAAGAAMIVVAVSLEYSWYERTRDSLPEGIEVALTRENQAPWRPWTYLRPFVDRFIAVDRASVRTHEAAPELRMVDLVAFARWSPPQRLAVVVDCATGRRVDLSAGVTMTEDGGLDGARWHEMGLDHPLTRVACEAS